MEIPFMIFQKFCMHVNITDVNIPAHHILYGRNLVQV